MKWSRRDIASFENGHTTFDETIEFVKETFKDNGRLRDLKDVSISGDATYDSHQERLYVKYQVTGTMIVPCSITLEDVEYKFSTSDNETYSFLPVNDEDDAIYVKGEIVDILPDVYGSIMAEVPWVIHKEGLTELPKGDGWEVVSEKDLVKEEKGIDPRLAKILEYKEK